MQNNRTPWIAALTLTTALALAACGKKEETPGEKLDSAIAKTEQKAEEVKADVKAGTEEVKQDAAQAGAEVKAAANEAGAKIEAAADKAGAKVEAATDKVAAALDDAGITTAVNSELAKDAELSALKINVDTKNGHVTLKGSAPNAAAKTRAASLAKAIKGVSGVDNQLVISK